MWEAYQLRCDYLSPSCDVTHPSQQASPYVGSLGIQCNADTSPGKVGLCLSDISNSLGMGFMVAMGEVQAGYTHTILDEFDQCLHFVGGWTCDGVCVCVCRNTL